MAEKLYFPVDKGFYCEPCYAASYAPTCGGCKAKITGKFVVCGTNHFHKECFKCT